MVGGQLAAVVMGVDFDSGLAPLHAGGCSRYRSDSAPRQPGPASGDRRVFPAVWGRAGHGRAGVAGLSDTGSLRAERSDGRFSGKAAVTRRRARRLLVGDTSSECNPEKRLLHV